MQYILSRLLITFRSRGYPNRWLRKINSRYFRFLVFLQLEQQDTVALLLAAWQAYFQQNQCWLLR